LVGAVEKAVLRMEVEVDELRWHGEKSESDCRRGGRGSQTERKKRGMPVSVLCSRRPRFRKRSLDGRNETDTGMPRQMNFPQSDGEQQQEAWKEHWYLCAMGDEPCRLHHSGEKE
jgi:hypothetical protein